MLMDQTRERRVVECGQESLVALSGPRERIGSADYRLHFFARQESNKGCCDASSEWRARVDSGQHCILRTAKRKKERSAANRAFRLRMEFSGLSRDDPRTLVQEEHRDRRGPNGPSACSGVPGQTQTETETIAIGSHSLWTGVPLANQAIEEELCTSFAKWVCGVSASASSEEKREKRSRIHQFRDSGDVQSYRKPSRAYISRDDISHMIKSILLLAAQQRPADEGVTQIMDSWLWMPATRNPA